MEVVEGVLAQFDVPCVFERALIGREILGRRGSRTGALRCLGVLSIAGDDPPARASMDGYTAVIDRIVEGEESFELRL